jgi:phosphoribosyl-dephospho-CoA transferase
LSEARLKFGAFAGDARRLALQQRHLRESRELFVKAHGLQRLTVFVRGAILNNFLQQRIVFYPKLLVLQKCLF